MTVVIFVTFLLALRGIYCANLTYLVKKSNAGLDLSCLAEENERYKGIAWIYPLESFKAEPKIVTRFVPNLQSDYDCKFNPRDVCNVKWAIKNWKVAENHYRNYDFLSDSRWEDFPTISISNKSEEFNDKFEIGREFRLGFSVRSKGEVEVFICSGWNPKNHPCFMFSISEKNIFLRQLTALPDKKEDLTAPVDYLESFTKIISHDEWRNFEVSFDAGKTLTLRDLDLNRTAIEYKKKEDFNIDPLYFLMRSSGTSLWKVHQNHFLYTTVGQIYRFGPQIFLPSKDLCISLYVTVCPFCIMEFFVQDENFHKKVLKRVHPQNEEWVHVKLKEQNVLSQNKMIFLETKFTSNANGTGFWAVDDVRICNENEVKLSFLALSEEVDEKEEKQMSCQIITQPYWRPKRKEVKGKVGELKVEVERNVTTANVTWSGEEDLELDRFILYRGKSLCQEGEGLDLKRIKSNGFLITKYNRIELENLVPYTEYNFTIASLLHEKVEEGRFKTLPTAKPTINEWPNQIQLKPSDTTLNISWDKINCTQIRGPLTHNLTLSNPSFTKTIIGTTSNMYSFEDLQPFTQYSLTISTARSLSSLSDPNLQHSMTFNITTQPGRASEPRNLEIYAINSNSVSIRYSLPEPTGIPTEVQIEKCNALSFKKCKTGFGPVKRCFLWPQLDKYCLTIDSLLPHQNYNFKISLKNLNNNLFGKPGTVSGYTFEQVPGMPTNITYKMSDCNNLTDYCNLNISWLHPYYQNGTISSFELSLNGSRTINNTLEEDIIKEIYTVTSYLPKYTYQVKYIPYSTRFDLGIQAVNSASKNVYRSRTAKAVIKTGNLGDYIDQSPKLIATGKNLLFKLAALDHRLQYYQLLVIVQDFNRQVKVPKALLTNQKISDHICHNFGDSWIEADLRIVDNNTNNLKIGEKHALKEKTQYCITFIVTNFYRGSEHEVVYYEKVTTGPEVIVAPPSERKGQNHLYLLLILLILVPVAIAVFWFVRRKRKQRRSKQVTENVYETLPLDEDDNIAVNRTYDQLTHK